MIEPSIPRIVSGVDVSGPLRRSSVLLYFEAVGYPRTAGRSPLDERVAQEFMHMLAYSRGGPKTEPVNLASTSG